MDAVIVRYSEIALKGENRSVFEKQLIRNINFFLKGTESNYRTLRIRGRIMLLGNIADPHVLKNVFGISSYSPAYESERDIASVKESISPLLDFGQGSSFRISVKRIDKDISATSLEIERDLGDFVAEKTKARVNLKEYDKNISIEFVNKKAYIYLETFKGFGGLPVGTQGHAFALIKDKRSILAALLMMKRGCRITAILDGTEETTVLERYYPFHLSKERLDGPIEDYLKERQIDTIITGKDIGIPGLLELNPVIGFSKDEIENRISEFEDV